MELQERQGEFAELGAELVVLGSQPEPLPVVRENVESHGITYTLLHDAETSVTRDLGLWSDHMRMPWMGYLIIDESGRIAAGDLQLDESKGAGPANVAKILAALEESRRAQPAGE